MKHRRLASVVALLLAVPAAPALAQLKSADAPEANAAWKKVRASLFAGRPISVVGDEAIELDTPVRADDAAIVPIAIRARPAGGRRVERLYLVIDSNPSPVSAIVQFAALAARADLETRVRINDYTNVRAIVVLSDGTLLMRSKFVKAAGGCSAPSGKDGGASLANLGRMKFRVDGRPQDGQPLQAQLMVSHPNESGFAIDPTTKRAAPAHYVREVQVSYGGKPVLSADLDFSISENPNFRFWFVPSGDGELKAEIVDSNALRFETALALSARD